MTIWPDSKINRALALALRSPVLLLLALLPASAATKKPAVADDFKPFAIITQRNVFNANRNLPKSSAPVAKPPKVEAFALLGTMSSERGAVAFFDGTSAAYRRAAQAGDKLGGHTVASVAHDSVTLQASGRELCLPLKMQLRREDQGEWQIAPLPDDFQPSASPPARGDSRHQPESIAQLSQKLEAKLEAVAQSGREIPEKYLRKLETLNGDEPKREKLLKSLNKDMESRLRKLERTATPQP